MNRAIFAGYLRSVDKKVYGTEGKTLATFAIEITEGKRTTTLPIKAFFAETVELLSNLDEGTFLFVEASVEARTWEGQNGPKTSIEVTASRVEVIGGGDDLTF